MVPRSGHYCAIIQSRVCSRLLAAVFGVFFLHARLPPLARSRRKRDSLFLLFLFGWRFFVFVLEEEKKTVGSAVLFPFHRNGESLWRLSTNENERVAVEMTSPVAPAAVAPSPPSAIGCRPRRRRRRRRRRTWSDGIKRRTRPRSPQSPRRPRSRRFTPAAGPAPPPPTSSGPALRVTSSPANRRRSGLSRLP